MLHTDFTFPTTVDATVDAADTSASAVSVLTAAQLRAVSRAAAAASPAKKSREEWLQRLMQEYLTWVRSQIPTREELLTKGVLGQSSVIIARAFPPTGRDGVRNPAMSAYFAGFDGCTLKDPSRGGVTILSLWKGFRINGRDDPSSLPGGQTIIDLLNAEFQHLGFVFQSVWAHPCHELHMVWDVESWEDWRARRAAQKRARYQRYVQSTAQRTSGRFNTRQARF